MVPGDRLITCGYRQSNERIDAEPAPQRPDAGTKSERGLAGAVRPANICKQIGLDVVRHSRADLLPEEPPRAVDQRPVAVVAAHRVRTANREQVGTVKRAVADLAAKRRAATKPLAERGRQCKVEGADPVARRRQRRGLPRLSVLRAEDPDALYVLLPAASQTAIGPVSAGR